MANENTNEGRASAGQLEGMLTTQGFLGSKFGAEMLRKMGPDFMKQIQRLMFEGGLDRESVRAQQAGITQAGEADVQQFQEEAARAGLSGLGGMGAVATLRRQGAAGQRADVLARESALAEERKFRNLGFINQLLFGGSKEAGALGLSAFQNRQQLEMQERAAKYAMLGSAIGGGASVAAACWAARAVLGTESGKWLECRLYLRTDAPDWLYRWYIRNGVKLANVAKESRVVRAALRPVFELAALLGRRAYEREMNDAR
jgi:hypothetical protein